MKEKRVGGVWGGGGWARGGRQLRSMSAPLCTLAASQKICHGLLTWKISALSDTTIVKRQLFDTLQPWSLAVERKSNFYTSLAYCGNRNKGL